VTSPSGTAIISARDLRKRYGALQAVDGVGFEVAEGEVFGILGPNGAGKTTTLEMIEGMRTIDSGSAIVDGIDVSRDPRAVKARIGIQLQASSFFDELNLVELLELFGHLYGRQVDAAKLLADVELTDKARSQVTRRAPRSAPCPADRSSASASPRHSSTSRASSSSMSRRRASTRRHAATCGGWCGRSATAVTRSC